MYLALMREKESLAPSRMEETRVMGSIFLVAFSNSSFHVSRAGCKTMAEAEYSSNNPVCAARLVHAKSSPDCASAANNPICVKAALCKNKLAVVALPRATFFSWSKEKSFS